MLFTMYIKPLSAIIDSHSIIHHSFADDLQLQMSAPPDRISELLHSMQSCISDVKAWATANMLKLNDSKTELMLVTSKRSKHLHNLPTSITIGNAQIPFKQSVKNLGFIHLRYCQPFTLVLTFPVFSSNTLPTKQRNLELTLLLNMLPQRLLLGQLLQLFLHLKKCHN